MSSLSKTRPRSGPVPPRDRVTDPSSSEGLEAAKGQGRETTSKRGSISNDHGRKTRKAMESQLPEQVFLKFFGDDFPQN